METRRNEKSHKHLNFGFVFENGRVVNDLLGFWSGDVRQTARSDVSNDGTEIKLTTCFHYATLNSSSLPQPSAIENKNFLLHVAVGAGCMFHRFWNRFFVMFHFYTFRSTSIQGFMIIGRESLNDAFVYHTLRCYGRKIMCTKTCNGRIGDKANVA